MMKIKKLMSITLLGLALSTTQYTFAETKPYVKTGMASYYADRFHGRKTASGERFNMHALTAAHNSLPMGSIVKVTCMSTGKSTRVRINDTGGFKKYGREIDLSYGAAKVLGILDRGVAKVKVELIK